MYDIFEKYRKKDIKSSYLPKKTGTSKLWKKQNHAPSFGEKP